MGICRDCFGKLSYTATNSDKAVFSVHKGDNRIIRHMPWYNTDARLSDPVFLWNDLPQFGSFVQAVRYLKENLEQLQ
ncbi:hypothetical protein [Butyrivibrio sp. INlla21]|uniref:hypothetical protein n=1 Tax=Butyrivibrio sp. INlla21 TaxID=1520811 RepID=UPI0008E55093|nr:hypothetical protein [Butyrivibrio sp. INlla21]SFU37398.1 hypothetical protein SAMN02910342_00303 [Butyrivibrio sp. INlla21]